MALHRKLRIIIHTTEIYADVVMENKIHITEHNRAKSPNKDNPNYRTKIIQITEKCDTVLHLRNGQYGLIEIKLGGDELINDGASALKTLANACAQINLWSYLNVPYCGIRSQKWCPSFEKVQKN